MIENVFFEKLVNLPAFIKRYNELLYYSVSSQFATLQCSYTDACIDWDYLITCASLLSQAGGGKEQDIAFRICQTCITNATCTDEMKSAAASILNILTNLPAVDLAKRRNFVNENYLSKIPFTYAMDVLRKDFESSIEDGVGNPFIRLNKFQLEVYGKAALSDVISISAPTSSGKSFVLLRLIKEQILNNSKSKIVYLVPTRALIQQVEIDINLVLKAFKPNVEITSVPVRPENWDTSACVMIFTQERLQWMLNDNKSIVFDLAIIDEAQKIGDGARGVLLQQVLQDLHSRNSTTKCLFASPMTSNPEELLKIIDVLPSVNNQVTSEHVTVNQNLIWLTKKAKNTTDWYMKLCHNDTTALLGEVALKHRSTKTSDQLPIIAFELSNGKSGNLIYANGAADAEKAAIQLKSLIQDQSPNIQVSPQVTDLIKLIKKTIHRNYKLAETLSAGVGFHYGNMPLAIRNGIEELFKTGDIKFLVCTSTLIEGVNLPAKTIYMRGPQKGKSIPMNEMDFWNLAGRAGRQGKEFQGNIICVDADDAGVWKTPVPQSRKKYPIQSSIERIYKENQDDFLNYIASGEAKDNKLKAQFEYAYTYFLSAYFNNQLSGETRMPVYDRVFCDNIIQLFEGQLKTIDLPKDILLKNQGVSPIAQQSLLNYFRTSNKSNGELIPPLPEEDDACDKYVHIIGRISTHLTHEEPILNCYRAIFVTNWMRGHGLARIISDNINYYSKKGSPKKLDAIIRETMKDIEEYARFRFLKFSTCYTDILGYYFLEKGDLDAIKKLPPINLWLEFGASKQTQISLMGMGFTRTAALEISELMVIDNYDKEKCLEWFNRNNVDALGLSELIVREISKICE